MSKVLQGCRRPVGLGWVAGTADDRNFHRIGATHELEYPAIVAQAANGLSYTLANRWERISTQEFDCHEADDPGD